MRIILGLSVSVGLAILSGFPATRGLAAEPSSEPKPAPTPELHVGNYFTPEEGKAFLEKITATYNNREEWEARAENIRKQIKRGANLDPEPVRNPLNPIRRSKRVHDGYSVENVAIEVFPGWFLAGNLYYPVGLKGPYAGVLCPHGHFRDKNDPNNWEPLGRYRADMQLRSANMARMGAVVFAYDMFAYGESALQVPLEKDQKPFQNHAIPLALTVQVWNGIRAVDYLLSLGDVDPKRIAITGASGGGTQTFLVAALDSRIAVSVPTVMVSASFFGGCKCESGLPIHKSALHETCNAEIAALIAPRPQLLISDGADWTRHTPEVELPYLRSVYALYGAEDKVENAHFADEKHDYGPSKRAALYPFLAKHLGLSLEAVQGADGKIDESRVTVEKPEALRVFDEEHPLPARALTGADAIAQGLEKARKANR